MRSFKEKGLMLEICLVLRVVTTTIVNCKYIHNLLFRCSCSSSDLRGIVFFQTPPLLFKGGSSPYFL